MNVRCAILLILALPSPSGAQSAGIRTYANPIDIDYKYNFEQLNSGISYRSGADPVIVLHRGEYFMFVTVSGGYWHSRDLLHWRFISPSRWPFEDIVAPAALSQPRPADEADEVRADAAAGRTVRVDQNSSACRAATST